MTIVQSTGLQLANAASSIAPALSGVAAGNTLVLLCSIAGGAAALPTDSSGQTWTAVAFNTVAGSAGVGVYVLENANAGAHTVTRAGGGAYFAYALVEIPPTSGTEVGTFVSNSSGNPSSLTATLTTTVAGHVFAVLAINATADSNSNYGISNPPTGFSTSVYVANDATAAMTGQASYQLQSSAGALSAAWTFGLDATHQDVAGQVINFKPAAGSGTSTAAETSAGTTAQNDSVTFTAGTTETSSGTTAQNATVAVPAGVTESSAGTTAQDKTVALTAGVSETSAGTTAQDDPTGGSGTSTAAETSAGTDATDRTVQAVGGVAETSAGTTIQNQTTGTTVTRGVTEASAGTDAAAATVTPPPGQGASGVRRWLIQYYTDQQEKAAKDKALKELSKEIEQASAGVITPRMVKTRTPTPVVTLTTDAAAQERARLNAAEKKRTDAQAQALQDAIAALSKTLPAADDLHLRFEQGEEDDMLLLSVL